MSISISASDVKRKAMIPAADTSYDTDITALIGEMQPALEAEVLADYLDDTSNTGLQAVLKLGLLEIMTGEFLEQLLRAEGAGESFAAGGVTIGTPLRTGPDLIAQGRNRLAPYLAATNTLPVSNTANTEPVFNREEDIW